jgi:signal transduction histidine kinase/CHASE3 domain sensor protein/ActR/RegA family two-component response regulator
MKMPLDKKIPLAFLFAIVLLIVLAVFAYRSVRTLDTAISLEIHTQEVLQNLDRVLINTLNAETGARGYILTGKESFLEPYNSAERENKENIARLRHLVSDDPVQKQRIADLENLINEKFAYSRRQVETYKTYGKEVTARVVTVGQGKAVMDKIRALIAEMKTEETALLRERENQLSRSFAQTFYLIIFGSIAGIVLLSSANVLIMREIRMRRMAEDELKDANKNLETRIEERTKNLLISNDALSQSKVFNQAILDSLSAHIAVVDKNGNIKAVNGAWKKFSNENGKENGTAFDYVGDNYINVCDTPDITDPLTREIAVNLKKLLDGEINDFSVEYPCHSQSEERWYLLNATALKTPEGGAVIAHTNITERKKAETELEKLFAREQEARREAETANRMRDEFLATVSHELRNPLNAILGWGRMLQKSRLDDENKAKAIETIVRNAESQNHLIEDLLDVSRIITGKLRLDIQPINPSEFVEAAIETARPAAEAKEITLKTEIDYNANKINGDPNRLQQIIWNLLSNAIKFTPKHGEVSVRVGCDDSMIRIDVADTGIGIPEEFLPHVFDRFSQADASSIRKFGGLGLGLAIVRHITEMHGGTVEVASEGENKGATFTVKLPIMAVPVQAERVESISHLEIQDLQPKTNVDLNGVSILVVDDEQDTRHLLRQILNHFGAEVKIAGSASEGFEKFTAAKPDILVSDIGMPEEDGYSLIRRIRNLPGEQGKTPAVALTAYARPQDRLKALNAGFQMHISKPVEPDELAAVIGSLIGRLQMN